MWRLRSLRWRLTLFYATLLLILVTILGVFIYFQLEGFLTDSSATRLTYQATPRLNLGRGGRPNDQNNPNSDNPLDRLSNQVRSNLVSDTIYGAVYNLQFQLITPQQQPDISGSLVILPFQLPAPTAEQFQKAASDKSYHFVTNVTGSGRVIVLILPVTQRLLQSGPFSPDQAQPGPQNKLVPPLDKILGFVVVAQLLTDEDQILSQLRLLLLVGALVSIVLILLLGLPIARLGLAPLNRMTATARRIADGDLSQRVTLKPLPLRKKRQVLGENDDEIRQLTVAFNQMLDKIEAAFAAQRQSEARTRQFVADASHELRTPLTTLGGSVDVLLMQARNDPVQAEKFLKTMRREIDRLSRMVVNLLQLTRIDANGAQSFHFEPLRLNLLAEQVCEDFKVVAGTRQLNFERLNLDQSDLWIRGDSDRLRQVITNLIDNAMRYTPEDGIITVKTGKTEEDAAKSNLTHQEYAILQVQDNGVGIESQHLGRIFDRFYRADEARVRSAGNAGLGLSIVKAIVEGHAGTIEVSSELGKGTTFTIHLPMVKAPQTSEVY